MVSSIARPVARRAVAVAAATTLLAGGLFASAASAQAPGTSVTVTPSTGLLDGDIVQVHASGYPPGAPLGAAPCDSPMPQSLADCDTSAASSLSADGSGSATFDRSVPRFISTNEGPRDCAADGCWLAVAAIDGLGPVMSTVAVALLSFAPDPAMDGLTVALDPPLYLDEDPRGAVTVEAVVTCEESDVVGVELRFWQTLAGGYLRSGTSNILVPCTAGVPLRVTSDLIGWYNEPGPAVVLVRATESTGTGSATIVEDTEVTSFADAVAALVARLSDPSDPTAADEFVAVLLFRLQYNPRFAQEFWQAVLAAS